MISRSYLLYMHLNKINKQIKINTLCCCHFSLPCFCLLCCSSLPCFYCSPCCRPYCCLCLLLQCYRFLAAFICRCLLRYNCCEVAACWLINLSCYWGAASNLLAWMLYCLSNFFCNFFFLYLLDALLTFSGVFYSISLRVLISWGSFIKKEEKLII